MYSGILLSRQLFKMFEKHYHTSQGITRSTELLSFPLENFYKWNLDDDFLLVNVEFADGSISALVKFKLELCERNQ